MPTAAGHRSSSGRALDPLGESLLRVVRAQMRSLRHDAGSEGISIPQFFALNWIARCGPVPTTAWAERIGTSPSTVSGLFDGLERLGHVVRRTDPSDRRRILVSVRPGAQRLVDRIDARRRTRLLDLSAGMGADERARATQLLENLAARMEVRLDRGGRTPPRPASGRTRARGRSSERVAHPAPAPRRSRGR
ncbi:MAG: MarR family winged helix-turn-helix transcriptional regulator [Thermoplasmata archaeon]